MKPRLFTLLILILALLFFYGCFTGGSGDEEDEEAETDDDDNDDNNDDNDDDEILYPPGEPGPFDVGVVTTYIVDESRYENWGNSFRILPLEIWYPSTGQGGEPNTISDMMGTLPQSVLFILKLLYGDYYEELIMTETSALRNAGVLLSEGPYPVIVFSHGLSGLRFQNYTLCEHLASHGFVVVAPDHYGNAIFTPMPDGKIVIFNPFTIATAFFDRTQDIEFIYSELEKMNQQSGGFWKNIFDLERFALSGHSYGGLTCLRGAVKLDFVDAIAPLNPAWLGPFPDGFAKPFFLLQGGQDNFMGGLGMNDSSLDIFYSDISDQKLYINLLYGGHYSATDVCTIAPPALDFLVGGCEPPRIDPELALEVVNTYMTAFFKSVLNDEFYYDDFLTDNMYPDDIGFETTWE